MDFLLGKWKGETKTWFDPKGKPEVGTIITHFQKIVGGFFIEEIYRGTIGEKTHEGRRIFGTDKRLEEITCLWMDTFHTGETAISFRGAAGQPILALDGHYYGGSEKWGWRMEFRGIVPDKLEMKHFNISPSGSADLAIESIMTRA